MRTRRRLLAAVLLLAACAPRPLAPRKSPEEAALGLFELAGRASRTDVDVAAIVDAEAAAGDPVGLAEVVSALGRTRSAAIVEVEHLIEAREAVVDLDADVEAAGSARVSVHVAARADGTWRVVAVEGPAIGWPRRSRPKGEGLTVSAPPS